MKKCWHTLLILVLSVTASSLWAATVYKWVDAQGNVHYSQSPPQQIGAKEMDIRVRSPILQEPPRHVDGTPDSPAEAKEVAKKKKAESAKQAEVEKKNAEVRAKNCKTAKRRFATINQGGRLYEVDENGERQYWDDAQRQAKLASAQADVDKWCK